MAEQIGVQSGARIGIHSHLNINQGGILNEYSRYGAYRRPFRTGALAIFCANDAVKSIGGAAWVLMKEITINAAQAGQYVISWEFKNTDNITTVNSRFRVNDVPISTQRDNATNGYIIETHNYDVNLIVGDRLQIYGRANGDTISIRNFRIYYDWRIEYFGDGTSRLLVTALPLSDVDLLDFTNTIV